MEEPIFSYTKEQAVEDGMLIFVHDGSLPSTKFYPGAVYCTPGANEKVGFATGVIATHRHVAGDWGDVCDDDKAANEQALIYGERLLSAYKTPDGTKFWIITEADRSATTILLPDEY